MVVGYHLGLATDALLEKHNITSDSASKENKIEDKIKAGEK